MVTFFMPLGSGSKWDNNETRYLLRSLEKNFSEDFEFIICADTGVNLDWVQNVEFYNQDRYYPQWLLDKTKNRNYENYFCTLDKVYQFVHSELCPEKFVYIYDDILLNKHISLAEILNIPECGYSEKMELAYRRSRHGKTILKAFSIVGNGYRFEHHLPVVYERDNLIEMFDQYRFQDMDIPYALATVYFNLYGHSEGTLKSVTNYKAGFEGFDGFIGCYNQDTVEQIEEAVNDKVWINYSDIGLFWKPDEYPLKKWITENFKDKSKYER